MSDARQRFIDDQRRLHDERRSDYPPFRMQSRPVICTAETAAVPAQVQCADCQRHFPGTSLWCFPHGNICDECKEERQDKGLQSEAFGSSPRQNPHAAV